MNTAANFPFRVGATSFVYPAGWADNVARLVDRVDDVELLFFEADHRDQLPGAAEVARLRQLKADGGLSYSLHMPLGASLASADPARRLQAQEQIRRCLDVGAPLGPERIVVHVYLGDSEHDPQPPSDRDAWRARATEGLAGLLAQGIPADRLCVETIDYDFALLEPVVRRLGLSVALDVGHQVRDGRDEAALMDRLLSRTRIVQWHGVEPGGRDHRSLVHYPRPRALALLRELRRAEYAGVLTLEVFRPDDFEESLALLHHLYAALDAGEEAHP